jgi:hypothetical protein
VHRRGAVDQRDRFVGAAAKLELPGDDLAGAAVDESLRVFLCIGGWLGVVGDAVSEVDA